MKDNTREGVGLMHYSNGDIFDGEWFKDKRGGKRGKVTMLDGSRLSGQFINDKADGTVEYEDKEGNIFQTEADVQSADNLHNMNKSKPSLGSRRNLQQQMDSDVDVSLQPGAFSNARLYG